MRRCLTALGVLLAAAGSARAAPPLPKDLEGVEIIQKLGGHIPLHLKFTTHTGEVVPLRKFFSDGKPVLLTLNYYRCKTLCSVELTSLLTGLKRFDWQPGHQFRIVTVSIDHKETAELAAGKRKRYLDEYGKGDEVDWSFLVGGEAEVQALTSSVGFRFRYIKEQDEFAHPAAFFVLSPEGKIVRYLEGLGVPSPHGAMINTRDLRFALMDASEGKVGSLLDKFIQSCFHYDPSLGRYGPFALGIMRLSGGLTVLILGAVLASLWRRERRMKLKVAQPT